MKTKELNETAMEDDGFFDSIGGYHSCGEGWNPHGCYCGECCFSTCEKCQYRNDRPKVTL